MSKVGHFVVELLTQSGSNTVSCWHHFWQPYM